MNAKTVTNMDRKRAKKERKGLLCLGRKVINLGDGEHYLFINGKPGKTATVVSEVTAIAAIERKNIDEKKNPMLAGSWHQYVTKTEKITVDTDDLITVEQYAEITSTPENKSLLAKLEKAETKRQKLHDDLDAIEGEIKTFNQELILNARATA